MFVFQTLGFYRRCRCSRWGAWATISLQFYGSTILAHRTRSLGLWILVSFKVRHKVKRVVWNSACRSWSAAIVRCIQRYSNLYVSTHINACFKFPMHRLNQSNCVVTCTALYVNNVTGTLGSCQNCQHKSILFVFFIQ